MYLEIYDILNVFIVYIYVIIIKNEYYYSIYVFVMLLNCMYIVNVYIL